MLPNNNSFPPPYNPQQGYIPLQDDGGSSGFFTNDQEYSLQAPLINANQSANLGAFGQNQGAVPSMFHQFVENSSNMNRMSSPASQSSQTGIHPNKVMLNARAAELKEKLRKRKDLPGNAHAGLRSDSAIPTNDIQKPQKAEQPKTDKVQTRPFTIEGANKLAATGDDIADMIAGISATTKLPAPSPTASTTKANANVSTFARPSLPNGKNGVAKSTMSDMPGLSRTTEPAANKKNITPAKPADAGKTSHSKHNSPSSAEEGEITGNTPNIGTKTKIPGQVPVQKPLSGSSTSTAPGLRKQVSPSTTVKSVQDKTRQEQLVSKRSTSSSQKKQDLRDNGHALDVRVSRDYPVTRNEAVPTPSRSNTQQFKEPRYDDDKMKNDKYRKESATAQLAERPKGPVQKILQTPTNGTASANPSFALALVPAVPSVVTRDESLPQDPDLRDWLEFTSWNDVEYRNRALLRFRRLREIEQERVELQQAAQEDARARHQGGVSISPSTPMISATPAPLVTPITAVAAMPTSTAMTTDLEANSSDNTGDRSAVIAVAATSAKRKHADDEDDGKFPRAAKYSRLEDREDRRDARPVSSYSSRGRRSSGGRWNGRGGVGHGPPSRPTSPRHFSGNGHGSPPSRYDCGGYRSSPPSRFPRRDFSPGPAPDFERRDERDFGRGDYERHRPRKLDLGRRGDTRYFMVKSFNKDNVHSCMQDGLWTTQIQNCEALTSAFAKCKHVIMFFSVNASRAFQGYARMATAPSPDTPAPKWMKGLHWECTPPFRVEWICTTEMPFHAVHHIKNNFNEGLSVIVGKDGQEIEEQCGSDLIGEMDLLDDIKAGIHADRDDDYRGDEHGHSSPPRGGYRGRGHRSRGRGRGRSYFKREGS